MANSIDGDGRLVGGWRVWIVTRLDCVMILVWSSLTLGEMHSLVAERGAVAHITVQFRTRVRRSYWW